MLLSSVLISVKSYLEDSGLLEGYGNQSFPIQITPDERPFAISGDNVITLYGDEVIKLNPTTQQRAYQVSFSLCVTKRTTVSPHDRL